MDGCSHDWFWTGIDTGFRDCYCCAKCDTTRYDLPGSFLKLPYSSDPEPTEKLWIQE